MLTIFALSALFEVLLWLGIKRAFARQLLYAYVVALAVVSGWMFVHIISLGGCLFLFFAIYRLLNLIRVAELRLPLPAMRLAGFKSGLWLIGLQASSLGVHTLEQNKSVNLVLLSLAVLSFVLAVIVAAVTRRNIRHSRMTQPVQNYSRNELPTVTVAIPARNETDDLQACLTTLLASDYPKLEILVLDDCSQERRTADIIRGFAHGGVIFVAGKQPPGKWLAKNYAYQQLADASNGELILFCGVDARFEQQTIRMLVSTLLQKNKQMISVIPRNERPLLSASRSIIAQSGRYVWELSVPRRWLGRTPVLSTCWLINRATLHAAGNFKAVKRSSSPESYFARFAARTDDSYSFVQSDASLGLSCDKSLTEQYATAIRTRYPQLHRRPELVSLVTLTNLMLIIAPLFVVCIAVVRRQWFVGILAGFAFALLTWSYHQVVTLTYQHAYRRSWLFVLPAAFYDIAILNISMWRYEFGEVLWKERNICVPPTLTVYPKLPPSQG